MAIFRCNPRFPIAGLVGALPAIVGASPESLAQIERDHGLTLAISGMIIVFVGLLSISAFIGVLPNVLAKLHKPEPRPAPRPTPEPVKVEGLDPATLAAITAVLHAEAERSAGQGLKVTLPLVTSPWALSSQMRVLPGRIIP